jgi:hypothetical protein
MLVCVKSAGGLCKWIPTRVLGSKSDSLKTLGSSLTRLDHNYGPYVFIGHVTYTSISRISTGIICQVGLPMHLCACVSEERGREGVGTLFLSRQCQIA